MTAGAIAAVASYVSGPLGLTSRSVIFTIGAQPAGGRASFLQFALSGYDDSLWSPSE